jgi:predicted enzyme related to lactoylglutathione lyase
MKTKYVCQSQPLITVNDVKKSSKWYQKVLGCQSGHGGDEYEQLVIKDRMILQLHAWEIEHHHDDFLGKKSLKSRGNGVVLWFMVDDLDESLKQIKKLKCKILKPEAVNPNANHREIWLQDPDGYTVVIAGHYGDL